MDGPRGTASFSNSAYRTGKAAGYVIGALLLVALLAIMSNRATGYTEGYMAVVALGALFLALGAVRTARCGFVVDDVGITAKMAYSTNRFALSDLDHAETVDRLARGAPMNLSFMKLMRIPEDPRTHIVPVLWLTSGKRAALHSLRITTRDRYAPNWVDEAMQDVNARLIARRGPMPS